MRKVLVDISMIGLVLGLPLAGMLLTIHLGSISVLSLLPTVVCGGIFFARYFLSQEFFFEQWIKARPAIGVPITISILAFTICCEVNIAIKAHQYQIDVPQAYNQLWDAAESEVNMLFENRL